MDEPATLRRQSVRKTLFDLTRYVLLTTANLFAYTTNPAFTNIRWLTVARCQGAQWDPDNNRDLYLTPYLQRFTLPAMVLQSSKWALFPLFVSLISSIASAQPSAQQINPKISLTLNSTTLLHSGQTVQVRSQFMLQPLQFAWRAALHCCCTVQSDEKQYMYTQIQLR